MPSRRLLRQAILLLLAACGGSTTGPDNPFEERSVLVSPTESAVLASADGAASVTIPPGAVSEPIRVTIRELRPDEIPDSIAVRSPIGRVWQLGPEGLQFDLLVEVRLTFDTDDLPPGVTVNELTMITIGLDGRTEELQAVGVESGGSASSGLQLSVTSGIRGLISHFSPFGIVPLNVRKTVRNANPDVGEPSLFDIEIRNSGTVPLTNVVLYDSMPFVWGKIRRSSIDLNTADFPSATVTIHPDSLSFEVSLGTLGTERRTFTRAFTLAQPLNVPIQACNRVTARAGGGVFEVDEACVIAGL